MLELGIFRLHSLNRCSLTLCVPQATWKLYDHFVQCWAQPNITTSQQSLFTQVQPRQTEFASVWHMGICSHPSWQYLGIAWLTLPLLFPISTQPQAVYSNLMNKISLNVPKKYGKQRQTLPGMWHLFSNRISIQCLWLKREREKGEERFSLVVAPRGRETEEKQGRSFTSKRAQTPSFTNT